MGYSIWTVAGELRLAPEHEADALAEIKRWAAAVTGGAVGLKLRRAPTLDEAFAALGFTIDRDEDGMIVGIDYQGRLDPLFEELPQLLRGSRGL